MVEWDSEPLVPVTFTVNVPLVEGKQKSVELPEPVTLEGDNVQASPIEGETEADSATVWLKPLTVKTETADVPVLPTLRLRVVGLALTAKSWTVTVTVAE